MGSFAVSKGVWSRLSRAAGGGTLAVVLGCADSEQEEPPFVVAPPIESFELGNGLRVITAENQTAPLVTALLAVRAGSFVEGPELNGYSHLFEHMMFQGSVAVPDAREYRDRIAELGAQTNAFTNIDDVSYLIRAPLSTLEPALELLSGALIAPLLEPAQLEKERKVVLGEFDLNESDPEFLRRRAALQLLFDTDATRLDPLGSRSVVQNVSAAELRAMHDRYYVPNNAALILSGAITRERAEEIAVRYFGDWARKDDPLESLPVPHASDAWRWQVLSADVSYSYIEVWWPGPSWKENPKDVLAGQLLSAITYQRDHSFRGLVSDGVQGAGLSVASTLDTGYVRVQLRVLPGHEAEALRALGWELQRLGEPDDLEEEQLERVKASAFTNALAQNTDPSALAFSLVAHWSTGADLAYASLQDRYAIDRAQLTRFARSHIRSNLPHVTVLMTDHNPLTGHLDEAWLKGNAP